MSRPVSPPARTSSFTSRSSLNSVETDTESDYASDSEVATPSSSTSSTRSELSTPKLTPQLSLSLPSSCRLEDFISPIPPRVPTQPLSKREDEVQFHFLADVPQFLHTVAESWFSEWSYAYRLQNIHSVEAMSECIKTKYCQRDTLNSTIIGTIGGELAVTAMLTTEDCLPGDAFFGTKPWLTGVYVIPAYRGRGLANAIINRLSDRVAEMGYRHCWLITQSMQSAYAKLGYKAIEETEIYGEGIVWTVMRRDFPRRPGERVKQWTIQDARESHAKLHASPVGNRAC